MGEVSVGGAQARPKESLLRCAVTHIPDKLLSRSANGRKQTELGLLDGDRLKPAEMRVLG